MIYYRMDTNSAEEILQELKEHNIKIRKLPPHTAAGFAVEKQWVEGRPLYYYSKDRNSLIPAVFIKDTGAKGSVEIDILLDGKNIIHKGDDESVSMEYILRRGIDKDGRGYIAEFDKVRRGIHFGGFLSTPPEGEDAQKMARPMYMNGFLKLAQSEMDLGFPHENLNNIIMIRSILIPPRSAIRTSKPTGTADTAAAAPPEPPPADPMQLENFLRKGLEGDLTQYEENLEGIDLLGFDEKTLLDAGIEKPFHRKRLLRWKQELLRDNLPPADTRGGGLKKSTKKLRKSTHRKSMTRKSIRRKYSKRKSTRRKSSKRKSSKRLSRRRRR